MVTTRSFAAWSLIFGLASACRPGVEEAAKCETGGDLSCPTGFHCSDSGLCVQGEPPPSVRITTSLPTGGVSGTVEWTARASCPRGLDSATMRLMPAQQGSPIELTVREQRSDDGLTRTLAAAFDTWTVQDGAYDLVAEATAPTEPKGPVRDTRRIEIANGVPRVEFLSPAPDAVVRGSIVVAANVTTPVPIQKVAVRLRRGEVATTVDAKASTDRYEATLDVSAWADGAAELTVEAVDVAGRTGQATRAVNLHASPLQAVDVHADPLGPAGSTATLVLSEAPAQAPAIALTGIGAAPPNHSADSKTWTWALTLSGATADVSGTITARSIAGDTVEIPLRVPVDLVAPGLATPLRLERLLAGTRLSFSCSEPAAWRLTAGAASSGTCGTTPTTIDAPGATVATTLTLEDAAGNTALFKPSRVADEDPYRLSPRTVRIAGGQLNPRQLAGTIAAATSPATLAQADGSVVSATANGTDTPDPASARPGPLRKTSLRPVPFGDATTGTLRFGLLEGDSGFARLSLFELAPDGTGSPQGWAPIDPIARPAWDHDAATLVFARAGHLRRGALFGPSTDLGDVRPLITTTVDSIVCAGVYLGIGQNASGTATALFSNPSAGTLVAVSTPAIAKNESARLACDTGQPILIAPDGNAMAMQVFDPVSRTWTARAVSLPARRFFAVGRTGLVAGGETLNGTATRDLAAFRNNQFQAPTNGPLRRNAVMVDGPRGSLLALGGTGTVGATGLVASSEDLYAEHGAGPVAQAADPSQAYDFTRGAMVVLADAGSPAALWEWTATAGWRSAATMTYRQGSSVIWRNDDTTLITGGMDASLTRLTTAFSWNGVALTSDPRALPVVGRQGTLLADGRLVLPGANEPAEVYDASGSTTMSLGSDVVRLIPTPGGDEISWTTAGLFHQGRVGPTSVTPLGTATIGASTTAAVLPGSSVMLPLPPSGTPTWQAIPSHTAASRVDDTAWSFVRGPCFSSLPAQRRAECTLSQADEDPPLVEFDDVPHPALVFAPAGSGRGRATLCASTRVGTTRTTDVSVYVLAGNVVGKPSGVVSGACRKFEFDYDAATEAMIAVVSDRGATSAAVTIDVDQLSALRVSDVAP